MKVSLVYPKIPDTSNCPLKKCWVFEKYDGTNIHWTLHPLYGWMDFGTRRDRFAITNNGVRQFEQAHPDLAGVDKLWDQDSRLELFIMDNPKYNTAKEIIIFTEYFGFNSFAGQHQPKDAMQLVIFDIQVDGKIIPPEKFLEDFKQFNIARVIFQGKFSGQLLIDIRKGKYNVKEGVVVKGVVGDQVYMAKIKTESYLERLKNQFKDNWENYWE